MRLSFSNFEDNGDDDEVCFKQDEFDAVFIDVFFRFMPSLPRQDEHTNWTCDEGLKLVLVRRLIPKQGRKTNMPQPKHVVVKSASVCGHFSMSQMWLLIFKK